MIAGSRHISALSRCLLSVPRAIQTVAITADCGKKTLMNRGLARSLIPYSAFQDQEGPGHPLSTSSPHASHSRPLCSIGPLVKTCLVLHSVLTSFVPIPYDFYEINDPLTLSYHTVHFLVGFLKKPVSVT